MSERQGWWLLLLLSIIFTAIAAFKEGRGAAWDQREALREQRQTVAAFHEALHQCVDSLARISTMNALDVVERVTNRLANRCECGGDLSFSPGCECSVCTVMRMRKCCMPCAEKWLMHERH